MISKEAAETVVSMCLTSILMALKFVACDSQNGSTGSE